MQRKSEVAVIESALSKSLIKNLDLRKPEVQRDLSIALCEILKQISGISGKGEAGLLDMYQMTITGSEKQG